MNRSLQTFFLLLAILVGSVHALDEDTPMLFFKIFFVFVLIIMALIIIAGIVKVLCGDRFGWETHGWSTCEYPSGTEENSISFEKLKFECLMN